MIRALIPALKRKDENRHLLTLFVIASLAIAFFYAAGLMYGRQTHMQLQSIGVGGLFTFG